MANRLVAQRRPAAAAAPFIASADVVAAADRAIALHRAGRFAEAIAAYEAIIAGAPALAPMHNNLGHALAALGKLDAAAAAYRRATELAPDNPETFCNWGMALADLGRLDAAEAKFRRAIALDPRCAAAYNNLGLILKEAGRLREATIACEQAIDLAPRNPAYYDNLAALRPLVAGDRYRAALDALAQDAPSLGATAQMHLHFALAKACDTADSSEPAFRHLLAANAFKRAQTAYDEGATLARLDRTQALLSGDFIGSRQASSQASDQASDQASGAPSPAPVFIIGMPRSGTTLIEQILASHPQVFGGGELDLFEQAVAGLGATLPPGRRAFPDLILDMTDRDFGALGAAYLRNLAQRAPGAARVTDKMPGNFIFAGLIHLALPNAIIIHAVRDALDTCVSCFSVHFTRGQPFSYDLGELGRYYARYQALMAHWHRVLPPGRIIDVHYEELVADLEGVARRLVAHCGLAWDPRCLDFHRTKRAVRTASAAQVRRPVYGSSVGRWRKYQGLLGPLIEALAAPRAQNT